MDSEVGASEPTMLLGAFSTTVKPFHAQSWSSGMHEELTKRITNTGNSSAIRNPTWL